MRTPMLPAVWKQLTAGNLPARLRVTRDGLAAIRLNVGGAALRTGVLDALADGSTTTADLAGRIGAVDTELLAALVRVAASAGLVRADGNRWSLTGRGRAAVDDALVRASYEAFPGFHTGVYRDLPDQLAGGAARRDIEEQGELIARLSGGFEPFVLGELARAVVATAPRRVLDVGCGKALELSAMLDAAPGANGVGLDVDAGAVELAARTLEERGLSGRAEVLHADVRTAERTGALAEPFDFALLANVLYYLPMAERVAFLRDIAGLLAPGGVLFLTTTVAADQFFSRHFDLLLRAQDGEMALSDGDTLVAQLEQAGFRAEPPKSVAPGLPIVTVTATLLA